MMNLGSVFVGKNETFWGVYDFIEETMMVTLVESDDKQIGDYCMYPKRNGRVIEVEMKVFAGNDFLLIKEENFAWQMV